MPAVDEENCIHCDRCMKVCQLINPPIFREPLSWNQGWAQNEESRTGSTSGGFAYEISKAFLKEGGAVCSCLFEKGEFIFRVTHDADMLERFRGSKYVKSNPADIYEEIRTLIRDGEKVLFIGLPCQSAGLQQYMSLRLAAHSDDENSCRKNLYTIDLICYGTPSRRTLREFLKQQGVEPESCRNIKFRNGCLFEVSADERVFRETLADQSGKMKDQYSDDFHRRINHLEGCYSCQYKRPERVSDLTLGDAWGTSYSLEELSKGISLALPMTDKGEELLSMAGLPLEPIDRRAALENNDHLRCTLPKPEERLRMTK